MRLTDRFVKKADFKVSFSSIWFNLSPDALKTQDLETLKKL
jgi:hypothetical protein